jgi:hypothetical protein
MTSFGILCCSILKDYTTGCRVAEAALEVSQQYKLKKCLPTIIYQHFAFCRHWQRPMFQFVAPCRYAMDLGSRLGQTDVMCIVKNMFVVLLHATSCMPLSSAVPEMERIYKYISSVKGNDQLKYNMTSIQFAYKLTRPHESNTTLDGDIITSEAEMYEKAKKMNDPVLIAFLDHYKILLLIHFGRTVEAKKHCKQSAGMGVAYGQGTPFVPRFTFNCGIVYYYLYDETRKKKYLRRARKIKDRLQGWAKINNPNWLHFNCILEAEDVRVTKKTHEGEQAALTSLARASVIARRLGSAFDQAYANELRALMYNNSKCSCYDNEQASYWMAESIKAYFEYGAKTKVQYLMDTYPDLVEASTLSSLALRMELKDDIAPPLSQVGIDNEKRFVSFTKK